MTPEHFILAIILLIGVTMTVMRMLKYKDVGDEIDIDFDDTDIEAFEKFHASSKELWEHDTRVERLRTWALIILFIIFLALVATFVYTQGGLT